MKEQYIRCLNDANTTPGVIYKQCLQAPINSHDGDILEHCAVTHDRTLRCIKKLIEMHGFSDCIGPENLKTLNVVTSITEAEKKVDCSVSLKEMNESQICTAEHHQEFGACLPRTLVTYPSTITPEDMAGFVYTKEYCEKWQKFKQCHMDGTKKCSQIAIGYFQKIHDARYEATSCKSGAFSPHSNIILPLLVASFTGLMYLFRKL